MDLSAIADAVPETDEPPLCGCGRGYQGHEDGGGRRCLDDPRETVLRLSFRSSADQWVRDPWRRVQRLARFTGACVSCGRRTYAFADGENDPRGALGDHADSGLAAADYEYPAELPDVPVCAICGSTEGAYRYALGIARARWSAIARGKGKRS